MSTSNALFMVRPFYFGSNPQTLESNIWQQKIDSSLETIQHTVLEEFDAVILQLQKANVDVLVLENNQSQTPDAVFPNNWVTFHENGTVILYPMMAESRRLERNIDILGIAKEKYHIKNILDWTSYEQKNKFLEGTGSMILDRYHKQVYTCLSPRTDIECLEKFATTMQYQLISFSAQINNVDCYHTNIIMSIAEKFAIFCSQSVTNPLELKNITDSLQKTGHEIIDISIEQVNQFAGNALEIKNQNNEKILAISQSGYNALSTKQINTIEKYCHIEKFSINTIEKYGGGSIRCMMAEIFLPKK